MNVALVCRKGYAHDLQHDLLEVFFRRGRNAGYQKQHEQGRNGNAYSNGCRVKVVGYVFVKRDLGCKGDKHL